MQSTIHQPGTGLSTRKVREIMEASLPRSPAITRPYVRDQVVQALQNALSDRDEIDAEIENMRRYLERTR